MARDRRDRSSLGVTPALTPNDPSLRAAGARPAGLGLRAGARRQRAGRRPDRAGGRRRGRAPAGRGRPRPRRHHGRRAGRHGGRRKLARRRARGGRGARRGRRPRRAAAGPAGDPVRGAPADDRDRPAVLPPLLAPPLPQGRHRAGRHRGRLLPDRDGRDHAHRARGAGVLRLYRAPGLAVRRVGLHPDQDRLRRHAQGQHDPAVRRRRAEQLYRDDGRVDAA